MTNLPFQTARIERRLSPLRTIFGREYVQLGPLAFARRTVWELVCGIGDEGELVEEALHRSRDGGDAGEGGALCRLLRLRRRFWTRIRVRIIFRWHVALPWWRNCAASCDRLLRICALG